MRLLLDANLSRRLLPMINEEFPGSSQVALLGLERASDIDVWELARREDYLLVTKDADFAELSAIRGMPPKVIWLRTGNRPRHADAMLLLSLKETIAAFVADSASSVLEVES